ncbi:MAG: NAD(+)/NADH kinase [Leptolyngbya sp.]|nr:NAD(+)/NADH kinase [Candidatus Melainabacteria bacterium]
MSTTVKETESCKDILVVSKVTEFEKICARDGDPLRALLDRDDSSVARIKLAHREHAHTLEQVEKSFGGCVRYEVIRRSELAQKVAAKQYDLIVTVGGDGTIIDVAHYAGSVPILGVNSSKSTSHGHFCLADAEDIGKVLQHILNGDLAPKSLSSLAVTINGKPVAERVFNEILICDSEIGETSRYSVEIQGEVERQRSDGFFIGTASGSTGWMHSYGADSLPITDNSIQYNSRGLIRTPDSSFCLDRGRLKSSDQIVVRSHMKSGILLLDGLHIKYQVGWGAEVKASISDEPVRLFIKEDANQPWTPPASETVQRTLID